MATFLRVLKNRGLICMKIERKTGQQLFVMTLDVKVYKNPTINSQV
jgi:hypothetical protein